MAQGPHVVQPVGQLDENHADVVHHRQQHLAEVLRLPLLAGREPDGADLGHPFHDVGDLGAEELPNALDGGEGVLDDIVEQAGGDGHRVKLHVRKEVCDREGMNQVRLPRMPHLSLVLEGREDVGPPEQLDVGVRAIRPHFFEQILETNHENRCLNYSQANRWQKAIESRNRR
jgi:hypothetical protein